MDPPVLLGRHSIFLFKNPVEATAVRKAESADNLCNAFGSFQQKALRFSQTEDLSVSHQRHSRLALDDTIQIIAVVFHQDRQFFPSDISVTCFKNMTDLIQQHLLFAPGQPDLRFPVEFRILQK